MKDIIFVLGPDDNKSSKITYSTENKISVKFVGILPIYPTILQLPELKKRSHLVILGIHKKFIPPRELKNVKLVNLIGNPDGNFHSLKITENLITDLSFEDVINNPVNIYKTSRLTLPNLIGDINNVVISKTVAVSASTSSELIEAVNKNEFSYPVIVRLAGYHNAEHMKKIDSEADFHSIRDWFSTKRNFIILEYINCLGEDGYYRKARIAVVGGKFFPQHFLSSKTWCVDVKNRYNIMLKEDLLRNDEKTFFESFKRTIYPKYQNQLKEIHRRINLDIYGIDCFFKDNGEIVIFEANACMDFTSMWLGPNNEYQYKIPYRAAVRDAIIKLMSN